MIEVIIYYGYITKHTIDANQHPDEQIKDLYALLKKCKEDQLIIYSNSPYILNEITLIHGYNHNSVPHPEGLQITNKHFELLENGTIKEGKYYKEMISDDNLLNNKLGEANDKYSEILDLAEKQIIEKDRNNYDKRRNN